MENNIVACRAVSWQQLQTGSHNNSPHATKYSGACQRVIRRTTGARIQQLEGSCQSDRSVLLDDVTRQLLVKTLQAGKDLVVCLSDF
jgi:hypothetical protein